MPKISNIIDLPTCKKDYVKWKLQNRDSLAMYLKRKTWGNQNLRFQYILKNILWLNECIELHVRQYDMPIFTLEMEDIPVLQWADTTTKYRPLHEILKELGLIDHASQIQD